VPEAGLYELRFSAAERRAKAAVWEVLCERFFQRYVRPDDTVLDVGAGMCEFINSIRCREKIALDADADVRRAAAPDVRVHCGPAHELGWLGDATVDVAFASNTFEHFASKADVLATLRELHRVLRPGGRIIVLQPNIRYAYREYWDFFDHHLPFSHHAMLEALGVAGFRPLEVRPRFLPYTAKWSLPTWPILVRIYLALPPLHRLVGRQMLIVATKPA
jgi:ubiquinone/menaquinone biosynthesis C-methylase UbiE